MSFRFGFSKIYFQNKIRFGLHITLNSAFYRFGVIAKNQVKEIWIEQGGKMGCIPTESMSFLSKLLPFQSSQSSN